MKIKKISSQAPAHIFFNDVMTIEWQNGTQNRYRFHSLRYFCPCAGCVDELTGERVISPGDIPLNVAPVQSEYVGNYALRIYWDDGHSTGIYTFASLRANHPAKIPSDPA